jgi:5-(carboxyamino)imidazole ribonucleotide synthase
MPDQFYQNFTLGILGGGQLGRMLVQSGMDLNIHFAVLDPDPDAPCSRLKDFTIGSLTDYETVLAFGRRCDCITIEIENVNVEALRELVRIGKKVFPQPECIALIQDKRTQKQFYQDHCIPTSPFRLTESREEVSKNTSFFPAVHKLGREGYDGRGVQLLQTVNDLGKAFDAPGLLEKWIDVEMEIAVIAARNQRGEVSAFPAVEMVFHPEANLVEYLFAPAGISSILAQKANALACRVIQELNMVGILAVEMFVTREGELLVNEVAPRPHNSGHQTIEANVTSQYAQHLRAVLDLPLGDPSFVQRSAMVNLLGAEGFSGVARYEGLEEILAVPGVHVHLYGKKMTKPFRKMGHVTIVDADLESLKKKVTFVKNNFRIIA